MLSQKFPEKVIFPPDLDELDLGKTGKQEKRNIMRACMEDGAYHGGSKNLLPRDDRARRKIFPSPVDAKAQPKPGDSPKTDGPV